MFKWFVLSVFVACAACECLESSNDVLSCYNTMSYDYQFSHITVLKLYDSIITLADCKTYFRSLEQVFVFGRFVDETCKDLEGHYEIFGCDANITTSTTSSTTETLPTTTAHSKPTTPPTPTTTVTPTTADTTTTQTKSTPSRVTTSGASPTFAPNTEQGTGMTMEIVIITCSVGALIIVCIAGAAVAYLLYRRRQRNRQLNQPQPLPHPNTGQRSLFTIDEHDSDEFDLDMEAVGANHYETPDRQTPVPSRPATPAYENVMAVARLNLPVESVAVSTETERRDTSVSTSVSINSYLAAQVFLIKLKCFVFLLQFLQSVPSLHKSTVVMIFAFAALILLSVLI